MVAIVAAVLICAGTATPLALRSCASEIARPHITRIGPTLSGVYIGASDPSAVAAFAAWRGAPAKIAVDYLPYANWSDVAHPQWWLRSWEPFTSSGGQLILSVPLLTQEGGSFAAGAAGAYDSYFRSLARALVAADDGGAILRLGWEFNGNWFPWSLSSRGANRPAEFISYWRQVVGVMRSVRGASFKFVWNVSPAQGSKAASAYPGNRYVDYIGVDQYDQGFAPGGGPIRSDSARWNQILHQPYGLDWWLSFALRHGKPIALPEWGLDTTDKNGGGDDPYFIKQMHSWIQQNHPAFESYYDVGGQLTAGSTPKAAAEYRRLWHGSSL